MRTSNIGGQAVMEGVMMKNRNRYAVAVRTPQGKIEVEQKECHSVIPVKALTVIPFVRGIFNLIDSLVLGMKSLYFSADFFLDEEEEEKKKEKEKKGKGNDGLIFVTMCLSVVIAVGLFIGLPFVAAELLRRFVTQNDTVIVTIESLVRIGLFLLYIVLVARMEDIQRMFMYHGAEHKCINCIEQGLPLNVENVRKSSKEHKRCGTSFLLIVMIVSMVVGILLFSFVHVEQGWLRLVIRLLFIPVVAGVAYEFIKLAGSSDSRLVAILSKPGLWLQDVTTKEPTDEMIQVGIASVEAVFDWRAFQEDVRRQVEIPGKTYYPGQDDGNKKAM